MMDVMTCRSSVKKVDQYMWIGSINDVRWSRQITWTEY